MNRTLVLSLTLAAGCAAGAAASSFVVRPLEAGADAPRWQYQCGDDASIAQLDEAGAQGWELVTVTAIYGSNQLHNATLRYCFKRPAP